MSFSCNHIDKQNTHGVEKKKHAPCFSSWGRGEPGLLSRKHNDIIIIWSVLNDKDRVSPVKINKNNTAPIYTRRKVSFFLRVTECQMVFELHWHLTEAWHHGNDPKEKNTSQVLVDLLSGAQGAFLNICWGSDGWLQHQEAPALSDTSRMHTSCLVSQTGGSVLQWFSLKMLESKL